MEAGLLHLDLADGLSECFQLTAPTTNVLTSIFEPYISYA